MCTEYLTDRELQNAFRSYTKTAKIHDLKRDMLKFMYSQKPQNVNLPVLVEGNYIQSMFRNSGFH
jgi:hypothetical protein